ncbi:signal peptidase I [Konateibacter massiliensis]|uniref:signal peptidase I n=1 Tax=Konateibacter massiliensis TaxID=2002841 RepID=UPI000C150AB9|nr:signal peptidase I [Konateibacter massiliensis]
MGELNFYKKKKKISASLLREIFIWIFDIAVVLIIAFALVHFIGEKTSIIGESMSPTLENDDVVIINKFIYEVSTPNRNDIVVFKPYGNEKLHYYIKRVIGLPGETVQIIDGKIYIDGEILEESIAVEDMDNAGLAANPITLGADEYFVLGDNRNNSEDSRFAETGNVNIDDIAGKAWFRIAPKNKIGFIE